MAYEDNVRVLHWKPDEDRWNDIQWNDWMKFRELDETKKPLPGVRGGIHYFVVCMHDEGVTVNIIPHKYLIEPDGRIGRDNFAGLTRQKRDDYQVLLLKLKYEPGDQKRMDAIHAKMGGANDPPKGSIAALKRVFPKAPEKGSMAEKFFREYGY